MFQAVLALPTSSRSALSAGFCGAPSPFSSNAGRHRAGEPEHVLDVAHVLGRGTRARDREERLAHQPLGDRRPSPSMSRLSCCSTRLASRVISGASVIALAKSASKKPSDTHQKVAARGIRLRGLDRCDRGAHVLDAAQVLLDQLQEPALVAAALVAVVRAPESAAASSTGGFSRRGGRCRRSG